MAGKYQGLTVRGNSVQIAFSVEGQRCRETIRVGAPPTKTQLQQLANKRSAIIYEASIGIFDYQKHFPQSRTQVALNRGNTGSQITIKEALRDWIVINRRRFAKSTLIGYDNDIHNHLIPAFGHLNLGDLKPKLVRGWIAEQSCSGKRINNILIPLRRMYSDAFDNELIKINAMERIRKLPHQSKEVDPFSLEEIEKILAQLEGQEKNLIWFAFYSGLRTSELIALRWIDVDLNSRKVHIRKAKVKGAEKMPKTNAGIRTIDLEEEAYAALLCQKSMSESKEFVFIDPLHNEEWESDQPIRKRVWIPALLRAGVRYRKPYATRHTYASMMLSDGRNIAWLAAQMGHKDWGMIRLIYAKWLPSN